MVDLPLEPIYEETIVDSFAQSEIERNDCNAQEKMNWQNKCQMQIEVGIMYGGGGILATRGPKKSFSTLLEHLCRNTKDPGLQKITHNN